LDAQILEIVEKLNITIVYDEFLEDHGKYLPIVNIIALNSKLNDFEMKRALLHELGHACEDHDNYELYKLSFVLKSKMEYAANRFMISYFTSEYDDIYNYSQLIEEFSIGMGYDVKYAK